jgi:hypothetical protein
MPISSARRITDGRWISELAVDDDGARSHPQGIALPRTNLRAIPSAAASDAVAARHLPERPLTEPLTAAAVAGPLVGLLLLAPRAEAGRFVATLPRADHHALSAIRQRDARARGLLARRRDGVAHPMNRLSSHRQRRPFAMAPLSGWRAGPCAAVMIAAVFSLAAPLEEWLSLVGLAGPIFLDRWLVPHQGPVVVSRESWCRMTRSDRDPRPPPREGRR